MKRWGVTARKVACQGFALGCLIFIQLVGARSARAESPAKVEGSELLGMAGYGLSLWNSIPDDSSDDKQIDPFGVTLGADFGHTFPFGLRLGTDVSYAFGRTIETTRWTGEVVSRHASSFAWGGSIGYDVLLSSFRLRAAAEIALLLLIEDGDVGPWMYFGPRLGGTWQYHSFELGVQSRWMIWAGGVQVGLLVGKRF
jgi:hypothetical protein